MGKPEGFRGTTEAPGNAEIRGPTAANTYLPRNAPGLHPASLGRCKTLPHGAPFQQAGARPGERIVVVVGADAQGVAQPSGPFRHDVLAETPPPPLLLDRGQHDHLGFFQVAVGIDAADHHLRAHVVGRQTRQVDGGAQWRPASAGHRSRSARPGIHKPHPVPHLADARVPARPFRGRGVVGLRMRRCCGVRRLVQLASCTRAPCGGNRSPG